MNIQHLCVLRQSIICAGLINFDSITTHTKVASRAFGSFYAPSNDTKINVIMLLLSRCMLLLRKSRRFLE